ncbi:hypothetical protein FHETE_3685 [Fusarium heterosporum]|uniref:Uncharacterized protein n=1 Tax=Fusarium heterosporum TaxID=42747 RepID=A0A8H5TK11_FUSHE|nr:hypothetical protein FHETE_3685 [Fusarium heterosporum]
MASELLGKLKETLAPTNTESHHTMARRNDSHNDESYPTESHSIYSQTTESYHENSYNNQREYGSDTRDRPLESTSDQSRQTEGVRTGQRVNSLVENVPGVPSSQSKPSPLNSPSHQGDLHRDSHTPIDAARAPPSALRKHLGEPVIEHDYPEDSTTRRHSHSHQEEHYNLR